MADFGVLVPATRTHAVVVGPVGAACGSSESGERHSYLNKCMHIESFNEQE
jgi:hypothetical protein